MSRNACFKLACAAVLFSAAAQSFAAQAQQVTRLKAKLTAFDEQSLTLEPLPSGAGSAQPPGQAGTGPLTVSLLPETKYVLSEPSSFGALKTGDYAGAAVEEARSGWLRARDVYVYAEGLRGTGEGRFADNGRLMVNGTVSLVKPASEQDTASGSMTLHYRGAALTGAGKNAVCEGRAVPPQFASALACSGDAAIQVPPGTPVSALTVGDKSLLAAGAMVSVTLVKRADGSQAAPGVIVEKLVTVEKPQSTP